MSSFFRCGDTRVGSLMMLNSPEATKYTFSHDERDTVNNDEIYAMNTEELAKVARKEERAARDDTREVESEDRHVDEIVDQIPSQFSPLASTTVGGGAKTPMSTKKTKTPRGGSVAGETIASQRVPRYTQVETADGDAGEKLNVVDLEVMYFLRTTVEIQHHLHRLAGHYFRVRYLWLSLLPPTLLAFTAAFLTLVAQTLIHEDDEATTQLFYLLVGTFSALSVFLQAIASFNKFGTRSDMHNQTANQLQELMSHMTRRTIGATFGETGRLDVLKFDARILEAMKGCTSQIPMTIATQFEILSARVSIKLKDYNDGVQSGQVYNKIVAEKAGEVADKIRRSFLFPWCVPSVVDKVVKADKEINWKISKEIYDVEETRTAEDSSNNYIGGGLMSA